MSSIPGMSPTRPIQRASRSSWPASWDRSRPPRPPQRRSRLPAQQGPTDEHPSPLALGTARRARRASRSPAGQLELLPARQRVRRSSSATAGWPTPTCGARSSSCSPDRFTCVALDLPLGSHRVPMHKDADLSPGGCGELIAGVLRSARPARRDTRRQRLRRRLLADRDRHRTPSGSARLVLNSCETPYDEFPPPPFDGLPAAAVDPAVLGQLLGALSDRAIRATPAAYGLLIKHPHRRSRLRQLRPSMPPRPGDSARHRKGHGECLLAAGPRRGRQR